jgi:hypothetical protein
MVEFTYREASRYDDGTVRARLFQDGRLFITGRPSQIDDLLQWVMRPGDTYQEVFFDRQSDVHTYEQMVALWREVDELDATPGRP